MSAYPAFSTPTIVISGLGSSGSLVEQVALLGGGNVALFGDRGLADAGLLAPLEAQLRSADDIELVSTVLVDVNPTVSDAEAQRTALEHDGIEIVVAVGGGSTLSLAKAVALCLTNPGPLIDYSRGIGLAPFAPLPSVAIPTTAGSGAEVSSTFVLYGDENASSVAFVGRGYEPDVALLDGELLVGLPTAPMRDAALDAYSHAFEALWAHRASSFSTAAAHEALRVIRETLPAALEHRRPEDLQRLLEASTLANIACGNSGLGLIHALTSATSIHVPHGRQNGIVLPIVADFNSPLLTDEALAEIALIDGFYDTIGAERAYRAEDLPVTAVDDIVAAAAPSPLRINNLRPTSSEELRALAAAAVATAAARR